MTLRVAILDDYFDTLRTLGASRTLAGHDVTVWNDHVDDVDVLAERLRDTEALVLIRERTRDPRAAARAAARRCASSASAACTRTSTSTRARGSASSCRPTMHAGTPSYATAELTWGLVLAAMRQIPQQMASLQAGRWQMGVGHTLRGKTLGIFGYGRIGNVVAGYGRAFGMHVQVWAQRGVARRAPRPTATPWPRARRRFFATCDVRVAAHAARRRDARHRHRGRPRADEADRAAREHEPGRADRARRAGRRAAGRATGHGRGRRVRARAADRPRRSAARAGQRGLHAAHRLRHRATSGSSSSPTCSTRSTPTPPARRPTS